MFLCPSENNRLYDQAGRNIPATFRPAAGWHRSEQGPHAVFGAGLICGHCGQCQLCGQPIGPPA